MRRSSRTVLTAVGAVSGMGSMSAMGGASVVGAQGILDFVDDARHDGGCLGCIVVK